MSAETDKQYQANIKPEPQKKTSPATPVGAVTQTQPMAQPVEQAAGFGEALSSLLATGGGLQPNLRDKKSGTYQSGAIKGMTEDQAVEYGKQLWDKAPKEIKDKYASRVQNRPADSERMAAFNQIDQAAQARANINSLPGADDGLVTDPETGNLITDPTKKTEAEKNSATASKGQFKKPMNAPSSGAGYGNPIKKQP